ncbi:hypothetical protein CDV55_104360 [Aspergillus turcosus]|uniref:Uncharacterized protein n=1 Tax=Aspergillus turcosus TaxID=1245748 RepID=A0A397GS55_9EURO|nr:hypothetical protein CDV55_104360 [Aspergillus turcosus]RLL96963.1 hypothetical protein CFD26_104421 [Aspergillus turcosus]
MDSIFEEWYRSAGFTDAQQQAIAEARQRFHTANGSIIDRIAVAITQNFTDSDAMVERWPSHIRKLMNQFSRSDAKEFKSWARPRDLEKRKQVLSVWISLLAFLVLNWKSYGADGALDSMGLNLSWTFKDDIDVIRYYAKSGQSLKVLGEMAHTFFVRVIKDATATPHTNPLAWWLAVLIQTEVLGNQTRWEVTGEQDTLSFSQKLEAIDHYARVLVLDDAIYRGDLSPTQKGNLQDTLNKVSISWIDEDSERPAVDIHQAFLESFSQKWRIYAEYLRPIFAEWLTGQTTGPLSTVILFLHGRLETPAYKKVYKVKMEIYEEFSVSPMRAACYPAEVGMKDTIELANKEARRCIRIELGPKNDSIKWDEVYDTRGMIRIRAIYQSEANDARAVAWVEEADSLIEDMLLSICLRSPDAEWHDSQIPGDLVALNATAWAEIEKRQSTSTWNPPAKLVKPLNEVWEHQMSTYSNAMESKNFGFDQVMAARGKINYCVRWDSSKKVTAAQRKQIAAAVSRGFNKWIARLAGFDGWPYNTVEVKVVGYAVRDRDEGGVPECDPACGRFFHQDNDYSRCKGGAARHYDESLWLTDGFQGGAGGDWGQRVGQEYFMQNVNSENIHIYLYEVGHTFGLDDFYDWTPTGITNFIMLAGSASQIIEFDIWMLRDWWRHLKSRYNL